MKHFGFAICVFLPAMMFAQAVKDVAPLKYWPAPLYWQPNHEESKLAQSRAVSTADVGALSTGGVFLATTPCRVVDTRAGFGFTGRLAPRASLAELPGVAHRKQRLRIDFQLVGRSRRSSIRS